MTDPIPIGLTWPDFFVKTPLYYHTFLYLLFILFSVCCLLTSTNCLFSFALSGVVSSVLLGLCEYASVSFFPAHILCFLCDLLFHTCCLFGNCTTIYYYQLDLYFSLSIIPNYKKVGVYFDYRSMHTSYNHLIVFILFLTNRLSRLSW